MKKTLSLILLVLALGVNAWADEASIAGFEDLNASIMRPDDVTRSEWMKAYENAPSAFFDKEVHTRLMGLQAQGAGSSISLLSHLQYTPSQRNQGSCGNCWVWASTGIMEIANSVLNGVNDRLSIQMLNSCKSDSYACCGGTLEMFSSWYNGQGFAVPWSNTNAFYQDGSSQCGYNSSAISCGAIATNPNYAVNSSVQTIPTTGVDQATAVANIKNVLNQNKGIYFAFYLADQNDWNAFFNFWGYSTEDALWNPDDYCGHTYDAQSGGGHAVLIVGYNDEDPDPANHYWIVLNSWGTASNVRPNGLFHMPIWMDYGCTLYESGYGNFSSRQFQTLDVNVAGGQKPNLTPYKPTGWSDKIVVSRNTGSTSDSTPLYTTNALYLDWAVINNGARAASTTFYTKLYVDNVEKAAWYTNSLLPNYYTYVRDYSIGKLSAGTHTLKIVTDTSNSIAESNETDNTYTKTITVQNPALPNLSPYKPSGWSDKIVVSKTRGTSADSSPIYAYNYLYVDWAVINKGNAAAATLFYTNLYVDGLLRARWYAGSLSPNYYAYVTDYAVGKLTRGTHTLRIATDTTNSVTESSESDNAYTKTITVY